MTKPRRLLPLGGSLMVGFLVFAWSGWLDCLDIRDRVVAAKKTGIMVLVCHLPMERAVWSGLAASILALVGAESIRRSSKGLDSRVRDSQNKLGQPILETSESNRVQQNPQLNG